jgi:hypothetical protein
LIRVTLQIISSRLLVLLILEFNLLAAQRLPASLPLPGCGAYNCPPAPRASGDSVKSGDCLAFLRLGDVYIQCGSEINPLTQTHDIVSFSLSEANDLAVIRERPDMEQGVEVLAPPYKSAKFSRSGIAGHLETTCGAQLLFQTHKGSVTIIDLRTFNQLDFNNAVDVRCATSDSARLVARDGTLSGADLILERGNVKQLISKDVSQFAISPNGTYIAFASGSQLCGIKASEADRVPICIQEVWTVGRIVVSDNGLVLITEQTSEACPYHWEKVPQKQGHGWPCEAIFSWLIGDRKDQLLGFLYRDPQIINRSAANAILATLRKR